ncbi:MAG TPA: glycosyltransferase [Thermodesulfobacteriota bacterium]|nr:glycosyltransferase [Thermodesulfobacteriota bacterium]
MSEKSLFFSIIIPTYNRPEQLKACLRSIAGLDYPRNRFEVIVVDDGGSVSLKDLVEMFDGQLDIKLVTQKNTGPASARNLGAINAKGEFLSFIDDDCMASSNWLKELADALIENPTCLIGGYTVNALPENLFSTSSQTLVHYLYTYYNDRFDQSRFFTSNNMALSAVLFRDLGGFDVTTLRATAEDRELCDRWLYHGYKMYYIPNAVVYHSHFLTFGSFLHQHFNYGRGAFYYHQARARRHSKGIRIEPLFFYLNLIHYPFSKFEKREAFFVAVLLVISQIANAAGFLYESFYRRIKDNYKLALKGLSHRE